ncbi:hypothetical protein GPECTOR_34g722 [Gonium pectorale]|uniref:Uncharacterized protein n=1 Tax=Gonium pectorale TaxID=33097 RepID=A0A150GCR1_GONPE|nr:hypothetical protein GPECTOR_34g722 [Gonium pectorale]|eukprot:KXZ47563.1 hypothetical protein GPECTOR_34g722 [Gonium pectorale]
MGNEVVEVANFKFVRMSKPAEQPPEVAAPLVEPDNGSPSVKDPVLAAPEWPSALSLAPADEHNAAPAPPRERNLGAEVQGLLSFVPSQCPTAIGVTWILTEALRIAVDPADEAGKAAASDVLQNFQRGLDQHVAAARRLLQGGGEQIQVYDKLPALVRELCAGEPLVASLRQQLAALEQEEAAWRALEEKYREGLAASEAPQSATAPSADGAGALGQNEVQRTDLDALASAQRRADVQLEFQVQSIDSMLDKAERLVAQAQQACSLLQADYHKENFQVYAHINSPQVLVKILSQVAPSAGVDYVPSSQPSQG